MCRLYGKFASYLRCVLCKTRLIFPRINGPIDTLMIVFYFFKKKIIAKSCFYCTKFYKQAHIRVTLRFYIFCLYSRLSLNRNLYKIITSVKRALELVPAFLYFLYILTLYSYKCWNHVWRIN